MNTGSFSTTRDHHRQDSPAFSRVDLLAVLAVLCVFLVLAVKSSAGGTLQNQAAGCLNNLRRLSMAWQLYAEDNNSRVIGNLDGPNVQTTATSNATWVLGWLDYTGGVPAGADTNTLYLTQLSPLAPYANRSAEIFKCPADSSLSFGTTGQPRVRSISMNGYLGGANAFIVGYQEFKKISEMISLPPARAFVFIDEREDGINDGWFGVDMSGFDPLNPSAYKIVDYPAANHDRGAGLGFADSHAELAHWQDARTMPKLKVGQTLPVNVSSPANPDVRWLQERSSRRVVSK